MPEGFSSAAIASASALAAAISRTTISIRSRSTEDNFPQFDLADFRRGVSHFLQHSDATAARQLIFIGEQNEVRHRLDRDALAEYERLYAAYGGARIVEDHNEFLENYKRIVRLIGRTFHDMGIEVLLHNLANPAKSICAIEGGEVTGRALELGTTSLVIDLKKRKLLNQDKLNYELNIGARRFKCTTIPIYRREFGLVGRPVHQHRHQLHPRRGEVIAGADRRVPGEVRPDRNAARGEHPEPGGVRACQQRQAPLAGRGSACWSASLTWRSKSPRATGRLQSRRPAASWTRFVGRASRVDTGMLEHFIAPSQHPGATGGPL